MNDKNLHDLKEAQLKLKILINTLNKDNEVEQLNLIAQEAKRILDLCQQE